MEALGAFIRSQRQLARLSLRQLAELTSLSNPYLSQVERGMHQPSVRVLKLIALNISAETLLVQAGLLDAEDPDAAGPTAEQVTAAIRADHRLISEQKNSPHRRLRQHARHRPRRGPLTRSLPRRARRSA